MMKHLYTLLFALFTLVAFGQSQSETITKSIEVKNKSKAYWFCVCNIDGDIEVEAYNGNTVEVEIFKEIRSRNADDVRQGMEDIQVILEEASDYARMIVTSPNQILREKDDPLECSWDWNRDSGRRGYRFTLDYKVRVPEGISVKVSTVNNGDVSVINVDGELYAGNVNGSVYLEGVSDNVKAKTVNGRLVISMDKMPTEFASFETVNGDISLELPAKNNGVYNFSTRWGKVYADFDFDSKVAPKVQRVSNGSETKYKIANSNGYQLGNGGPQLDFETLNGDIRIKKK